MDDCPVCGGQCCSGEAWHKLNKLEKEISARNRPQQDALPREVEEAIRIVRQNLLPIGEPSIKDALWPYIKILINHIAAGGENG